MLIFDVALIKYQIYLKTPNGYYIDLYEILAFARSSTCVYFGYRVKPSHVFPQESQYPHAKFHLNRCNEKPRKKKLVWISDGVTFVYDVSYF